MPLLSLAHFTAVEADPITLIEAAQAGGYDAIGLRIVPPFTTDHVFPVIGDRNVIRSIKRRLLETGVRVLDVEAIWLTAESDVATLEPALDTAVELGAGYVIVVGNDPDRGRLAGSLSRLCAAASLRGGTGDVGIHSVFSYPLAGTSCRTACRRRTRECRRVGGCPASEPFGREPGGSRAI